LLQVLSALDILQPPHLDFFQEMYPFSNARPFDDERRAYRYSPHRELFILEMIAGRRASRRKLERI
jgi:hypothetical protein